MSKRPPPGFSAPYPPKRTRLSSSNTPEPEPAPASSQPNAAAGETNDDNDDDDEDNDPAHRPETAAKFLGHVGSVGGSRRGDGSGYHPPRATAKREEEDGGAGQQLMEVDKPADEGKAEGAGEAQAGAEKTAKEEAALVEEASKGVAIDDSLLADEKEVGRVGSNHRRVEVELMTPSISFCPRRIASSGQLSWRRRPTSFGSQSWRTTALRPT